MRPLFTIHAGEYLVGSHIEKHFKNFKVWIPSKDVGIDLLITDPVNKKAVSLQVKYSKDFKETHIESSLHEGLKSCGWWTLNKEKIEESKADFWIFVLYGNPKNIQYVIIRPKELLGKLKKLHGDVKTIRSYLWVTKGNKCWETRELRKKDHTTIAKGTYENAGRDFTKYLNDWESIKRELNI